MQSNKILGKILDINFLLDKGSMLIIFLVFLVPLFYPITNFVDAVNYLLVFIFIFVLRLIVKVQFIVEKIEKIERELDSKGQSSGFPGIIVAIIFIICIGVILTQLMPPIIGNFIAPAVQGTQSGAMSIFLWYIFFPAIILMLIFVAIKNMTGQGGG